MNDIKQIEERIKALQSRIENLRKEQEIPAREEAKKIHESRSYEWRVEWKSDFLLNVSRRLDEKSWSAIKAWEAKYPEIGYPHYGFNSRENPWEGMNFYLIEGWFMSSGGGHVVLISKRGEKKGDYFGGFEKDPFKLTDLEISLLKSSRVPKTLIIPN